MCGLKSPGGGKVPVVVYGEHGNEILCSIEDE
jgi:hypothetical protein